MGLMNTKDIHRYLAGRLPIERVPLDWDSTGYTSDSFESWASSPGFPGWVGDLPTEEEAQVMVALLEPRRGDSLLDVACGYGRHPLELASRFGLKVTGIDISPGLIASAKRRAAQHRLEIEYEVRDARDLAWSSRFDQAIIALNSFSLFSPEDALVVLRGIHQALRPAGRLFLDLDNKSLYVRLDVSHNDWYLTPGGLTLQEVYFHEATSVEVMRDLIFTTDSEQVTEFIIFKRIYSLGEITDLLSTCGFSVDRAYGSWDLSPLDESSPKMLLVGAKE